MRRILFLVPDLDYRGHARQAMLLATTLPRERFATAVASLGPSGPWANRLTDVGIGLHQFERGHRFDFQHWFALRRVLRDFQPDLIHVWGLDAFRALRYAAFLKPSVLPPMVLSLPPSYLRSRKLSWWERRLLSRVSRFIASCEADRIALSSAGLGNDKIATIRPGTPTPNRTKLARHDLGIPPGPILMSVGHMQGFGRLMDSIWITEILAHVVPDVQTVIIGEGDFRLRILEYFHAMPSIAKSVHFLGARADAAELFSLADIVIVPHRRLGGTFTTLEAMAAGKPVVATRLPHLAEIIRDGETGMLANSTDQPGLARACMRLLESPDKRESIGSTARETASRAFALDGMTAAFATTYDDALIG